METDISNHKFNGPTSFEDLCIAMEDLIERGMIRGWGLCNDNAYGLTACTRTAKALGITPPCSIQGDFSLIDRKVRMYTCFQFQKSLCQYIYTYIYKYILMCLSYLLYNYLMDRVKKMV